MTHDAGDRDAAEKLTEAFRGLDATIREALIANQRGGTTQITKVDAGGWGVLVALILVAFLAGLNLSQNANQAKMAADINDIKRRNDLANDKLSVILQWAPDLAKKVDQTTTVSTTKKGEN